MTPTNRGSKLTVWTLSIYSLDAEGEEWEQLEEIYHVKPTKEQLEERFKYHSVNKTFFDTLLEKGEAYGGGYDNWHFSLQEVECT